MVPAGQRSLLFDWAARERLALFPIPAFRKRPGGIVRSHADDWSLDPNQWERWYVSTGGCNFGVACTPSRLIVVDVDADDARRPYFDAFWSARVQGDEFSVATPSGGWHIPCRLPAEIPSEHVHQVDWEPRRINTRARNGYVVAPWCQTRREADDQASDGDYAPRGSFIQIAPPELLARCVWAPAAPVLTAPPVVDFGPDGYPADPIERIKSVHLVERLVARLRQAVPGERNNALNEAAFALGRLAAGGAIDGALAEMLAAAEGEALGLPREEARATARSGLRGGMAAGPDAGRGTALDALLAAAVPVQPRAAVHPQMAAPAAPDAFPEPIVERLLYEGLVTTLSGHGGTGKTTVGASLMAASAAGVRDFVLGVDSHSDALVRPASWVFVSYEGGQFIDLHRRAWHAGSGAAERWPGRVRVINRRGPLVYLQRRDPVMDEAHAREIAGAVDAARAGEPGLPVVLAMDNVTSAIEDSTDPVQAQMFMRGMRAVADMAVGVILFAHPPKKGGSVIYGAHQLFSLADIVGELEVVRRDSGEWTQWVSFEKHRPAPNGLSLELISRRLREPLVDLPADWGGGNARARDRALQDLRTPWIAQVRVRPESEREAAKGGVRRVDAVTAKPAALAPAAPPPGAVIDAASIFRRTS